MTMQTMKAIPKLLMGPPGCGKTAAAHARAAETGKRCIYLPLSERDPTEVAGAAYLTPVDAAKPNGAKLAAWAESEAWNAARTEPCVVILDELTAASRVQRVAALRYADPSNGLHPDTEVWATCNPPEYAAGAGDPLTAPELTRFRVQRVDQEPAVRWMCAAPDAMVRRVGGYLRANIMAAVAKPELITQCVDRQEPFATPRGWTRAAMSGLAVDIWGELIGEAAALEYMSWITANDLPDAQLILDGKLSPAAKGVVPERGDAALAVATSLVGLMGKKASASQVDNALAWAAAACDAGFSGIIAPEFNEVATHYSSAVYKAMGNKSLASLVKVLNIARTGKA